MTKETKTNVMRLLDRAKISYEILNYACEVFTDGLEVARKTGVPPAQSFKTLVVQGKSHAYYVLVIPTEKEIDLKKAAHYLGEKSVEMIPVKEIQNVTGYIRGGCSPLGMKKEYRTVIQQEAADYPKIYVSGGRLGSTVCLAPGDLLAAAHAEYADVTIA